MRKFAFVAILALVALALVTGTASAQCILANPSFELAGSGGAVFGGWNQFGAVIKEGVVEDFTNRDRISPLLRERLNGKYSFVHPEDPRICSLTHLEWTGHPQQPGSDARNAVFYGDAAIDNGGNRPVSGAPWSVNGRYGTNRIWFIGINYGW